jgi:hypothetical protein
VEDFLLLAEEAAGHPEEEAVVEAVLVVDPIGIGHLQEADEPAAARVGVEVIGGTAIGEMVEEEAPLEIGEVEEEEVEEGQQVQVTGIGHLPATVLLLLDPVRGIEVEDPYWTACSTNGFRVADDKYKYVDVKNNL